MPGTSIEQDKRHEVPVSSPTGGSQRSVGRHAGVSSLQRALRCVWSADPSNGRSCHSHVPQDVVTAAWREELEASADRCEGFFHFVWHGGVWLAYGLKDGRVRGVCCAAHGAERPGRSCSSESRDGTLALAPAA